MLCVGGIVVIAAAAERPYIHVGQTGFISMIYFCMQQIALRIKVKISVTDIKLEKKKSISHDRPEAHLFCIEKKSKLFLISQLLA